MSYIMKSNRDESVYFERVKGETRKRTSKKKRQMVKASRRKNRK